jgi:hypothetical protein
MSGARAAAVRASCGSRLVRAVDASCFGAQRSAPLIRSSARSHVLHTVIHMIPPPSAQAAAEFHYASFARRPMRRSGALALLLTSMSDVHTTPNQPAAPNAGIASPLAIGHRWPGVGEPDRC